MGRIEALLARHPVPTALAVHPARRGSPAGAAVAQWSAAWTRTAGWGRVALRGILRGEGFGIGELGRLGGDFSLTILIVKFIWRLIFLVDFLK